MKKLINTDKILILALVATVLSFLKFVISVSIYEELIELQKDNKKSTEESEVKEHEEDN